MRDRGRPSGLTRLMFRAPILLYRLKLGWLLGNRFLRLTHTGRNSGLQRDTVLEVVDYDPENKVFVVSAAWVERSDWFQNIVQTPNVLVQVGNQRWPAVAERIDISEARQALLQYALIHPSAFRSLTKVFGFESPDTKTSVEAMASELPMVALKPRIPVLVGRRD